jgi:hypothetical protein
VVECRSTDSRVTWHAVSLAKMSGGSLRIAVIAPPALPAWLPVWTAFPFPVRDPVEVARGALARSTQEVPEDIFLAKAIDAGRFADVVARQVDAFSPDVIVARRRRLPKVLRRSAIPVVAVG